MAASNAEGCIGVEIAPMASQAAQNSQVEERDHEVVIPLLLQHSSRETGMARSDHRAVRDRAHPVVSDYGTTSGSRTRGRPS